MTSYLVALDAGEQEVVIRFHMSEGLAVRPWIPHGPRLERTENELSALAPHLDASEACRATVLGLGADRGQGSHPQQLLQF